MADKEYQKLSISSVITERWLKLDADVRAQHILSNSDLYQQIQLIEETLRDFRRLEDEYNDNNH